MTTTPEPSYTDIVDSLRAAYDAQASARDQFQPEPWKVGECLRFLTRLQAEGKSPLLELGPGPGVQAKFFHDHGLQVLGLDLSPENVRLCREKGLDARVGDILHLNLSGQTFDAALTINCLLHMPVADLPRALRSIRNVLEPGALLDLGQYGGFERAGVRESDTYEPKRFYSFLSNEHLLELAALVFEIVDFRQVEDGPAEQGHFHALTLHNSLLA
ncbi:MAG: class I SAM-dependent methyltransferase [Dehalococcoidia bacterium]|nr:class I SAM-dependent methyltransferase [Dehalococcoidia bacterium]